MGMSRSVWEGGRRSARERRRKTLRAVDLRGRPFGCRCEAQRRRPVVLSSPAIVVVVVPPPVGGRARGGGGGGWGWWWWWMKGRERAEREGRRLGDQTTNHVVRSPVWADAIASAGNGAQRKSHAGHHATAAEARTGRGRGWRGSTMDGGAERQTEGKRNERRARNMVGWRCCAKREK
jgi:hypothetical protein